MTKEIRLNAFMMNTVGHQSPGLWRHPRDQSGAYHQLAHWTSIARTLEKGLFDTVFLADVLGVYDVYGGTPDAAWRAGIQTPIGDPFVLVSAMAAVTEHLGFGITGNTGAEPPMAFARRMATLDHLTGGRVGWNIVTGFLKSAAKGQGQSDITAHGDRYAIAEEFTELVYALWEESWADDAAGRDPDRGFADPDKIRVIDHDGAHFRLQAAALTEPSPQRTPVIFQAGASPRGRDFAARHAECVFIAGPSAQVLAPWVADIRTRATAHGRAPDDIRIFAEITVIPAETDTAAQEKHADYARYIDPEGALALVGGWTGVDFAELDWDTPITYQDNDALKSHLEAITTADPDTVWTKRRLAEFAGIGGIGPVITGSPKTCADAMQHFMAATDIDGYNLAYAVWPESFQDVIDLVIPELQARGAYKTAYDNGSLRHKLFGQGARLAPPHPAASIGKTLS